MYFPCERERERERERKTTDLVGWRPECGNWKVKINRFGFR
jgi:hypothetical protein